MAITCISKVPYYNMSQVTEKPVFQVSDHVRHKAGCTNAEDGKRLEILDLDKQRIVPCSENKGTDQLHGNRAADLRFCFHICKKLHSYLHGTIWSWL